MDPITVNKLLSVADAIETHRETEIDRDKNQLSLDAFYKVVESQGQVKRLNRRVQDILRIFESSQWIARPDQDRNMLCLTEKYDNFIHAWNSGDYLLPMNEGLTNYPPYALFLKCLKQEQEIKIPARQDTKSRTDLGRELKDKYGITFVAFDTFRTWAVSVGHAYRSPFEAILYWGGEWDIEHPSLESFKAACWESYNCEDKTSGYANLGRLAHRVCQQLRISFQAFEMKMNEFVKTFPGEIRLAPATIRREVSGHFRIVSIRPRKEVLRKRLSVRLLGEHGQKRARGRKQELEWIESRYLEDGMRINGKLVKLVRWEVSK